MSGHATDEHALGEVAAVSEKLAAEAHESVADSMTFLGVAADSATEDRAHEAADHSGQDPGLTPTAAFVVADPAHNGTVLARPNENSDRV